MGRTGDHYAKLNKARLRKTNISCFLSCAECISKTTETMERHES
jgi:hypothetical protein